MTPHRSRSQLALAALAGVIAAGVAIGVAQLVAVPFGPRAAPIIAVGQGVIRLTPEPVKEFAIRTFGENDKIALLVGTFVLLTLFAAVIGLLAARSQRAGVLGVALLGGVAAFAAVVDPTGSLVSALPSVVGGLAGIGALLLLLRPLRSSPSTGPDPATSDGAGRDPAGLVGPLAGRDRGGSGTDRRAFLASAGAATAFAATSGLAGRHLLQQRFDVAAARARIDLPRPVDAAARVPPSADLELNGLTPWRTSNGEFYRVDTALVLPQVDPESWELRVRGMVERPLTLQYTDLLDRPLVERWITMTCVSNEVGGSLVGNARWLGVPLAELLDEAGVDPRATQLVGRSVDGFTTGSPVEFVRETEGAMVAIGMNGEPLPVSHGFPARIVVPGLYGYVSATKWLTEIELTTFEEFDPYWIRRGWARRGLIKTSSRIDVPRPLAKVRAGQRVAVAGVAWAQTRGISRVEVQVDDGPWQQARLAAPVNEVTWRQWVWEWTPRQSGQARLQVRAYDGDGELQVQERQPVFPSGSTGWHSVVVRVA